jgi:hypothetical protein
MEYVWKVTNMASANISSEPDVIIRVQWTLTGTEGEYSGVFIGVTPLSVTDIDPATFVPYDQLTQDLVLSWVKPIVMSNDVFWAHINEKIALQVAAKRDQVNTNIPLPWNPTPAPTPPTP